MGLLARLLWGDLLAPASSAAHYSSIASQLLLSRGSERDSCCELCQAAGASEDHPHGVCPSLFWISMGFCLSLNLQGPQGSPQGGFSFAMLTVGQVEAAELRELSASGGFPHRGWPELLMRHLQRDRSLQEPTVGMVLSALTQGAPHLPLGSRPKFHRQKHHTGFIL